MGGLQSQTQHEKNRIELIFRVSWLESFNADKLISVYMRFLERYPKGRLTKKEFVQECQSVFPEGDVSEFASHVFRVFDQNDDGKIDFREFFWSAYALRNDPSKKDMPGWAFRMYDVDGDNYISMNDMRVIFEALPESKSLTPKKIEEIEETFKKRAPENDGRMALSEFKRWAEVDYRLYGILLQAIPTGKMSKDRFVATFKAKFQERFPRGDASKLAGHVFRIFDQDKDGFLDYQDIFWAAVTERPEPSITDKLGWAFDICNLKNDGCIKEEEMREIFTAVYEAHDEELPPETFPQKDALLIAKCHGGISRDSFLRSDGLDSALFEVLMQAIPKGNMTRDQFVEMYQTFSPGTDSSEFANHVFRTVKRKIEERLDYEDFFWTAVVTRRSHVTRDKIGWAFRIYDLDNDGYITQNEMEEIFMAVNKARSEDQRLKPDEIKQKAKRIFTRLDAKRRGKIKLREFIAGAENDDELYQTLSQVRKIFIAKYRKPFFRNCS